MLIQSPKNNLNGSFASNLSIDNDYPKNNDNKTNFDEYDFGKEVHVQRLNNCGHQETHH